MTPTALDIPAAIIADREVSASAAIATGKLKHRYQAEYSQPNTTATPETKTIYVARSAGIISEFLAGVVAPNTGTATVTIDLRKNGTSVLATIITLDSTNLARIAKVGVLNGAHALLNAGDWLELVITATVGAGTLGTGLFVTVVFELPQITTVTTKLDFSVVDNSQFVPLV